jgi:hypothetical protein
MIVWLQKTSPLQNWVGCGQQGSVEELCFTELCLEGKMSNSFFWLGFELRSLHLLCRHSTTWAMPPAPKCPTLATSSCEHRTLLFGEVLFYLLGPVVTWLKITGITFEQYSFSPSQLHVLQVPQWQELCLFLRDLLRHLTGVFSIYCTFCNT